MRGAVCGSTLDQPRIRDVRPDQFNDDDASIAALGITHVVFAADDFVERHMRQVVPTVLAGRRRLGTVRFRDEALVVWELAPRRVADAPDDVPRRK